MAHHSQKFLLATFPKSRIGVKLLNFFHARLLHWWYCMWRMAIRYWFRNSFVLVVSLPFGWKDTSMDQIFEGLLWIWVNCLSVVNWSRNPFRSTKKKLLGLEFLVPRHSSHYDLCMGVARRTASCRIYFSSQWFSKAAKFCKQKVPKKVSHLLKALINDPLLSAQTDS